MTARDPARRPGAPTTPSPQPGRQQEQRSDVARQQGDTSGDWDQLGRSLPRGRPASPRDAGGDDRDTHEPGWTDGEPRG